MEKLQRKLAPPKHRGLGGGGVVYRVFHPGSKKRRSISTVVNDIVSQVFPKERLANPLHPFVVDFNAWDASLEFHGGVSLKRR